MLKGFPDFKQFDDFYNGQNQKDSKENGLIACC